MGNIKVGSNTNFYGGQLIAGQDALLGSNLISLTGPGIQAVRDIKLGSTLDFTGCAATTAHRFSDGKKVRLVN